MTNDGRGGHPAVAARAKHPRPEGLREPKTRDPKTRDPKTRDPKTRDPKTRDPKEAGVREARVREARIREATDTQQVERLRTEIPRSEKQVAGKEGKGNGRGAGQKEDGARGAEGWGRKGELSATGHGGDRLDRLAMQKTKANLLFFLKKQS